MSINRNLSIFSQNLTSSGAITPNSAVLSTASTSTLGVVKVDGSSITISNGVISSTAYSLPTATTSTLGGVKVDGTTITISNGVVSVNTATTSTTGGVKIDGTSIAINTGVISLNTANTNTFTNTQIFSGSATALAAKLSNAKEVITISATAATGTINIDVSTQSILYYTTNSSANFTINIRANASNTLNSVMNIGESVTVVFMNTNGGTAYYPSAFQVDGVAVTPKWQGGTAPTTGNASATDVYTYTIIKTAASTYTVLAAQSKFV